ncbi:MAG: DUF1501 domain-containing protein [Myxococcales bacterium]|nr:DUF1501 domain-containing protein [Myxococcales bacterium]
MDLDRRTLLAALASGLPLGLLRTGVIPDAWAAAPPTSAPQYLILSSGSAGDPMNANCPGSCGGLPGVVNNPAFPIVDVDLGAVRTRAAEPWGTLPDWVRARSSFVHHMTYQNSHPGYGKVMTLLGNGRYSDGTGVEQITSIFSDELAGPLGTIQNEPVPVAFSELTFQGRALHSLTPTTLASMFAPLQGTNLQLQALRDQTLDAMNARLRSGATPAQRAWLDHHARSRIQARELDDTLVERFSDIEDDLSVNQAISAVTLILMRVSPVIVVQIGFGGDNHADADLLGERDATLQAMSTLTNLFTELDRVGLRDQVTVANLHVFGRTLVEPDLRGRDHNLAHHVMMTTGVHAQPGVMGGLVPFGNDYGASALDSVSGVAAADGDIGQDESLEAACKTLGVALGIERDVLDTRIEGGKVIEAAVG